MGFVYRRGNRLYVRYKEVDGRWVAESAGVNVGQEKTARAYLSQLEAQVRARVEAGERECGPLTGAVWEALARGAAGEGTPQRQGR